MPALVQVNGDIVGHPRMGRILADCGNDAIKANALFEWNLKASGAFYESMHLFEIILRNAMDHQLGLWNANEGHTGAWLITPDPRLNRVLFAPGLTKARTRAAQAARSAGRPVTHDDVLAQMTLATWRFLLPSNSSIAKQRLWTAATSHAFPRWRTGWPTLVTHVEAIHELRNRVAHLEPLHAQKLRVVRRAMRQVSNAISYEAGRIYVQNDRTGGLISQLDPILH